MGINQSQHSMGVNQHIIGDSYLISCMVVAPCCLKACMVLAPCCLKAAR
ncbi:putative protein pDP86L [African swine fever virus]|nr:putative protein pKP86R [African swine fever virus]QZK26870.1 putative protein pDP86L [African swine fever virus]WAS30445.1 putative protein pKP86R [African swine fever virus]WAS30604.1 putative protein pDP86L [African swine fever virus]WNL53090.1 pKP86R [African swine fever virus]